MNNKWLELKINLLKSKYLSFIFILQFVVILSLIGIFMFSTAIQYQTNRDFKHIFENDYVYNIMDIGGPDAYDKLMTAENIDNIENLYRYIDEHYTRIQQIQNQFNADYDVEKIDFMTVDKKEAERFGHLDFAPYQSLRVNENFFKKYDISLSAGHHFQSGYEYELGSEVPVILGDAYTRFYNIGDTFSGDYFLFPKNTTYRVLGFLNQNSKYYNLNLGTYVYLDHYILVPDVDINIGNAYREEVIIANYAQRIPGVVLSDNRNLSDLVKAVEDCGLKEMYRVDDQKYVVDLIYKDATNMAKTMLLSFGILSLFGIMIIIMSLYRRISANFKRYAVHLACGASLGDIRKLVMSDLIFIMTISTSLVFMIGVASIYTNPLFRNYTRYFPAVFIMMIVVDLIIYFIIYAVINFKLKNMRIVDFIRRLEQ